MTTDRGRIAPGLIAPGLIAALLLGCCVAACGDRFSLVEPGSAPVGDAFTVTTPIAWNEIEPDQRIIWTRNGIGLDEIVFFPDLEAGDSLVVQRGQARKVTPMPALDPAMAPSDIMDLVVDTVTRTGGAEVTATDLRPAPFGGLPGFRFALSYYTDQGLKTRGLVAGAHRGDRLHLIIFTAPAQHFFTTYRGPVEAIFESVVIDDGDG